MAKTIKSLLRISMVIRNLGTLNNFAVAKRLIRTSTTCCPNYNKDSLVSARPYMLTQDPNDTSQTGPLHKTLQNCNNIPEIFSIIQQNSKQMKGVDAVAALKALFHADKDSTKKIKKIHEKKEFLTLCEIVKKEVRQFPVHDVITMLKVWIYFEIPASSVIVNITLQMLRHKVNQLTLQEIIFVDFLLAKCEDTPLVEALRIALPIVFESNVLLKVDRKNLHLIVSCLQYLSKKSTNNEIITALIALIEDCNQPMDLHTAKSILWSLIDLKYCPNELTHIVRNLQNVLAQDIASLDRQEIRHMLTMIAKETLKNPNFYHEGFADACASAVISDDWGFTDAVSVLGMFIKMDHMQISLLDYIAAKCFEDPTILQSCSPKIIAQIVNGFSDADYKPVFWDVMQESVTSDRVLDATLGYPPSVFAVHLLSLDCYCPKLLERIFGSTRRVMNRFERGRILLLYQAAKTLYPQYSGPWPDESIVDFLSPTFKHTEDHFPLIKSLESALGGRRYVLTNIRSKLGHHIDHVIVMRKGGFTVSINNEDSTASDEFPLVRIDELQPPPDGQVLLILYVPGHAYSVNTQRMKGTWSLKIKSLEALTGYTVIPIQSLMWEVLPPAERIPYLMQAIRLKCDDVSISANS